MKLPWATTQAKKSNSLSTTLSFRHSELNWIDGTIQLPVAYLLSVSWQEEIGVVPSSRWQSLVSTVGCANSPRPTPPTAASSESFSSAWSTPRATLTEFADS